MQNVNKSQLLSISEFKKLNESESNDLSQSDLERLDCEIRTYEIKLEDYLISEFPDEDEDIIFKFIDNISSAYIHDRKYEQLKDVLSNFNEMRNRFHLYIK